MIPRRVDPSSVDTITVAQLQTLAPAHSTDDAEKIRRLFDAGSLFPRVTERTERIQLQSNVLTVQHMIPSLFSFFEDIKFLEPCAKVVRSLCTKSKRTVRQSLMGSFFDPEKQVVECAPDLLRICKSVSSQEYAELAYVQVWLYAFRHFPQMSNTTTRKSPDKVKPTTLEPSPALQQALGHLAVTLGFRSEDAYNMQQVDPTSQIISQLLRQQFPNAEYEPDAAVQLSAMLRSVRAKPRSQPDAVFTSQTCLETLQRCGRPYEDDHCEDQGSLFLPQVLNKPDTHGRCITTFYRKWNMLRVFFAIDDVRHFKHEYANQRLTDPRCRPWSSRTRFRIIFRTVDLQAR